MLEGLPEAFEKRCEDPQLISFWEQLKSVRSFTRLAKRWNGKGEVAVHHPTDTILIFQERGSWQAGEGQNLNFSNTFRWTLDCAGGVISLEHLRHGPDQPVFLFHLIPIAHHMLASADFHLCEEDVYLATVSWDRESIRLNWRVIGPKKNEEMECCYTRGI